MHSQRRLHGSCVSKDGNAILLLGPSVARSDHELAWAVNENPSQLQDVAEMLLKRSLTILAQPDQPRSARMQAKNDAAYFIAGLGITAWYDRADALSAAAVADQPDSDAVLDTRGAVLAVRREGQAALPLLERGLAVLEREDPRISVVARGWSHMFLARAFFDAGDRRWTVEELIARKAELFAPVERGSKIPSMGFGL